MKKINNKSIGILSFFIIAFLMLIVNRHFGKERSEYEINYKLRKLSEAAIEIDTVIKPSDSKFDRIVDNIDEKLKEITSSKYIGKKIHEFSYPDINGKLISVQDYIGNWVLIDVWASWCSPCIGDMPSMNLLKDKYKNHNIVFLGISMDSEALRDRWLKV